MPVVVQGAFKRLPSENAIFALSQVGGRQVLPKVAAGAAGRRMLPKVGNMHIPVQHRGQQGESLQH